MTEFGFALRPSAKHLNSGPELLRLHLGALTPAVSVSVLQLGVVLLAVLVALHLLDVAVVTSLLARMTAEIETETTIVETEATDPAAQMIGKNNALIYGFPSLTVLF